MNLLEWGLGACGVAGLIAVGLRSKMKADAILQDGAWVGSALLGTPLSDEAASFIVLRGAPEFREQEPFRHRGGAS